MILQLISVFWAAGLGFFSLQRLGLSRNPSALGALAFAVLPCRTYPGTGRTSEILLCWVGPLAVFLLIHWLQDLLSPGQPVLESLLEFRRGPRRRPSSSREPLNRKSALQYLAGSKLNIFLLLLFILIPSFANSFLLITLPILLYIFAVNIRERVPRPRMSNVFILCFAFFRGIVFDQTLFPKARNLQGSLLKLSHLVLPSPQNPYPPIQEWRSRNFGIHEPFVFESEVSRSSSLGILLTIGFFLALINLLRPGWKRTEVQRALLLLQLTLIPILVFGGLGGISNWVVASASWIHFVAAVTLTLECGNPLARHKANSTEPKHPRSFLQNAES